MRLGWGMGLRGRLLLRGREWVGVGGVGGGDGIWDGCISGVSGAKGLGVA